MWIPAGLFIFFNILYVSDQYCLLGFSTVKLPFSEVCPFLFGFILSIQRQTYRFTDTRRNPFLTYNPEV